MIVKGFAPEGTQWYLPARVVAPDQVVLGNDSPGDSVHNITNIDLKVFDLNGASPETPVYTATAITVNTLFDRTVAQGPLVDGYWVQDTIGRNFLGKITAANFEQVGGHVYSVEYSVTLSTFGMVPVDFEVACTPRRSS